MNRDFSDVSKNSFKPLYQGSKRLPILFAFHILPAHFDKTVSYAFRILVNSKGHLSKLRRGTMPATLKKGVVVGCRHLPYVPPSSYIYEIDKIVLNNYLLYLM